MLICATRIFISRAVQFWRDLQCIQLFIGCDFCRHIYTYKTVVFGPRISSCVHLPSLRLCIRIKTNFVTDGWSATRNRQCNIFSLSLAMFLLQCKCNGIPLIIMREEEIFFQEQCQSRNGLNSLKPRASIWLDCPFFNCSRGTYVCCCLVLTYLHWRPTQKTRRDGITGSNYRKMCRNYLLSSGKKVEFLFILETIKHHDLGIRKDDVDWLASFF